MPDMTGAQVDALARFLVTLRPGWQGWTYEDVRTALLGAGRTVTRDLGLLTHAAIAATLDPTIGRPAVIGMEGRHWERAHAAHHRSEDDRRPRAPRIQGGQFITEICEICGKTETACRARAHLSDHDYQDRRTRLRRGSQEEGSDVAQLVRDLKARLR